MNPRNKAKFAVELLKEAVLQVLTESQAPMSHADILKRLDIPSDFEGKSQNYLSWSVLGLLVNDGAIRYEGENRARVYFLDS